MTGGSCPNPSSQQRTPLKQKQGPCPSAPQLGSHSAVKLGHTGLQSSPPQFGLQIGASGSHNKLHSPSHSQASYCGHVNSHSGSHVGPHRSPPGQTGLHAGAIGGLQATLQMALSGHVAGLQAVGHPELHGLPPQAGLQSGAVASAPQLGLQTGARGSHVRLHSPSHVQTLY